VREQCAAVETARYGRAWSREEIMLGFLGDVSDLAKLVQGKEGVRPREDGVWTNERWRLTRIGGCGVPLVMMLIPRAHHDMGDLPDDLAAELGVLSAHLTRHVEALPNISRCHVYRVGDGGAHLHVWLFARPLGQGQLYGSWLPVWDDLLPEYPDDLAQRDAEAVARALSASYGERSDSSSESLVDAKAAPRSTS